MVLKRTALKISQCENYREKTGGGSEFYPHGLDYFLSLQAGLKETRKYSRFQSQNRFAIKLKSNSSSVVET